jgi:hypothetical protein
MRIQHASRYGARLSRNTRKTGRPAPLLILRTYSSVWRRGKARSFALLMLLCLRHSAPSQTAPEPPIAPDSGYSVQLCGQCNFPRVVELAVSGKKAFVAKEQPQVVEVSLGTEHSEFLANAFTPEWICAAGKASRCMVQGMRIKVSDSIQRTGTYTVIINLQPSSQPLLPRWKLQVVQAPAQADAQPIDIIRYRYWPYDETPPLQIRNSSDAARLTLTTAAQWDAFSAKGRIEITGPLPEIKPKDTATLPYTLAGDFPDGKITHTLRFEAPQLTAPATVTVDVETRWIGLYLWFAVLLGLGAGYYVKVILRDRIELAKARVQADDLLREAQGARDRIEDPEFRNTIDPLCTALRNARNDKNLTAIQNAHDALARGLQDATVSHATRLQDARKALEAFRAVLKPDWRVPPTVTEALRIARDGLAGVEEFLKHFNAQDAQTRINALRDALAGQLRTAYNQWPAVAQTLVRLANANAGIPAGVVTQMTAEMQNAPPDWQTIKPTPVPAADSDISATLADYEPKLAFVNGVLTSLGNRLEREWTEVTRYLDPVRPRLPHPADLQNLEQQWRDLITQLRRGAQDAAGPPDISDDRLRDLQQAWFTAYTSQLAAPNQQLEQQLNNRDFVQATRTLAGQFPVAGQVLGGSLITIDWKSISAPPVSGAPPTPATPAQATPWFPYVQRFEPSPTDVIRRSQLIQSAIVLIIMTVSLALGAVTANQGSWSDLFHAFTLAFAADVTLDALLARLKA